MAANPMNVLALVKRTLSKTLRLWGDNTSAVFPMERCISDILIAVFQALVDDEAMQCFIKPLPSCPRRRMPVTLALVCRLWKELVYGTASLWATVVIDKHICKDRTLIDQGAMRHRILMARDATVDLHILDCPAYCEYPQDLTRLLHIVPNLVRLRMVINGTTPTLHISFLTKAWPELQLLKQLYYYVEMTQRLILDVTEHFASMSRLTSLRFTLDHAMFTLSYHTSNGRPIFPILRHLDISGILNVYRPVLRKAGLTMIPQFLSHCPRIETVKLLLFNTGDILDLGGIFDDMPNINLASLTKLAISGVAALVPFSTHRIASPTLHDFSISDWGDQNVQDMITFIQSNPGITQLFISIPESSLHYLLKSVSLTQVASLSMAIHGTCEFLSTLCIPMSDNAGPPAAPSLRSVIILLGIGSMGLPSFTKFVEARCIPINKEGTTAAGYPALDYLFFTMKRGEDPLVHARNSGPWRRAIVTEDVPNEYRLRWEYEPPSSWINSILSRGQ